MKDHDKHLTLFLSLYRIKMHTLHVKLVNVYRQANLKGQRMTDRIGSQVGNYRLISRLGHGGFAEVYVGSRDHNLYAFKLPKP